MVAGKGSQGVAMAGVSGRVVAAADELTTLRTFFETLFARTQGRAEACDFTFGNPHEMPLPGLVAALQHRAEPRREDWFAYKTSEPEPREVVAAALSGELGLRFVPEDVALTRARSGRSRSPSPW